MRHGLITVALLGLLAGCGGASRAEVREDKPVWEDPDRDPYNFYRSVVKTLLRTQQHMKAQKPIKRMQKLRPDSPEPHLLFAESYIGLKQLELARRALARAVDLDDEYAPAHSQMGVLLNMMGEHEKADAHHRRALELEPDNAAYHNNLGFSRYLRGRYQQAIKAYQNALEHDAGTLRIHNNIGFAYGKLGDVDRAYRHFKLAGLPAQASNNLGFVYEEQGRLDRAYDFYLIALEQDPELVQARRNLERVCKALGRPVPEVGVQLTSEEGPIVPEPPQS